MKFDICSAFRGRGEICIVPLQKLISVFHFQYLKKKKLLKDLKLVCPNEATETDLRFVHTASYLRSLKVYHRF